MGFIQEFSPSSPWSPSSLVLAESFATYGVRAGLADWVNEYGPVISLQQGRQVTIIVGRMDVSVIISACADISSGSCII